MHLRLIFTLIATCLANEAFLVTVNKSNLNLPKVPVYEFWDGKSSYFSTRQTQSDPRWRLVRKAFCIAGAMPVGSPDWSPLNMWVYTHSSSNMFDCLLSNDEGETGPPRGIGQSSSTISGYTFMGRIGFVAKKPVDSSMVQLWRRFSQIIPQNFALGKHYFSLQSTGVPAGDTSSYNTRASLMYVWPTC